MGAFHGFSPEAIVFLHELEDNNDRDWFEANRARYDKYLAGPANALGEDLADLGAPRLLRPFNDARFHQGSPLKERVTLAVGHGEAGGFYVELSLDGLLVAAGLRDPAPDQLERIRRGIDDGRTAAVLTRALAQARAAGMELNEPELVRAPRGYSPEHPRIALLRRRRLVVARRHLLGAWIHRYNAGDRIRRELEAAAAFVQWLRDRVGPSRRETSRLM